ncbi:MAG TPA: SCP2 sterol-binding domain-containing protein [Actinomycetota bacterium]|nr:SCP2 sterol-binding domain-containing protein [Actinomycetota bacterium]
MPVWPSEEWSTEYAKLINASSEYREAAHDWEGVVVYHFQAEPDKGLGGDVYGWFDLWHGECREAKQVTAEEAAKAEFLVSASYSTWKQVLLKQLDPMKALMQGRLKMRGDLPKAVRYTKATMILNDLATQVADTGFLDELPKERLQELADAGQPVVVPD